MRCLIVDDNERFLTAASGLLRREGVDVVGTAHNRAEATARIEELRPDVALLDIDLGEESGLELARLLADRPGLVPTALILISAHGEEQLAELIDASPAAGFIAKDELSAAAIRAVLDGA